MVWENEERKERETLADGWTSTRCRNSRKRGAGGIDGFGEKERRSRGGSMHS